MKKAMILVLLFMMILMATSTTFAVTTLYIGGSVDGNGTTKDYQTNQKYSGDIKGMVVDFTNISEIKKIKVDIDYEFGDFRFNSGTPTFGIWNTQVGFPVVNHDKGLVYLTLGEVFYNEYSDTYPKHEVASNMIGLDIVATPLERLQFEVGLQHSIFDGTSELYSSSTNTTKYSSPELTVGKLKVQYIFTDNLGFSIQYRIMDFKVKQLEVEGTRINTTVAGFIYRF